MRLRALGLMMLGAALLAPASAGAAGSAARDPRVQPARHPEHRGRLRPPDRPQLTSPSTPRRCARSTTRPAEADRPADGPRTASRSRRATCSRAGTPATRCDAAGPAPRAARPVSYTNRYGALIRGNVFAPLPSARTLRGAPQAALPRRRYHDRLGPGLRAHVLLARPGPRRAWLRRPHL